MRPLVTLLLLFILTAQNNFGQDTLAQINTSWTKLKTELQRRTDLVSALTNKLSRSSKVDKEQLNNARTFAIDLFKYIDTLIVKDSLSVAPAYKKNNKLTQALARALITLENDKKFMANNEVQGLLMQLEGIENRIAVAKRDYNDTCKEFKRRDLLFRPEGNEKITTVAF